MDELRCVTWNVHGYAAVRGGPHPERTLSLLAELDADVIALQEVPLGTPDAGIEPLRRFAGERGATLVWMPARASGAPGARVGNALLTRLSVSRAREHDISVAGREPRQILDVHLSGRAGALRVLATHFGLRARERARQTTALTALLRERPDEPALLAGDFNEWRPRARTISQLDAELGPAPRVRSFPACLPLLRLDRIWVRPQAALIEVRAVDLPGVRAASDHLPVLARVRWPLDGR